MIYISSDLHLNHDKPFIYTARGYSSVEEMNKDLITKFNNTVTDEDEVYILGDLCLGGADSLIDNFKMLSQLNGNIHIILGNHDTETRRKMYEALPQVVSISYAEMIHYRKYHFYLSHYPTLTANLDCDALVCEPDFLRRYYEARDRADVVVGALRNPAVNPRNKKALYIYYFAWLYSNKGVILGRLIGQSLKKEDIPPSFVRAIEAAGQLAKVTKAV